jgi:hypothetical protein
LPGQFVDDLACGLSVGFAVAGTGPQVDAVGVTGCGCAAAKFS